MVRKKSPTSKKSPALKELPPALKFDRRRIGQNADKDSVKANGVAFPLVGIGASAGGLEAFTLLLTHLPADTGMGFVLVQHLDPVHESALTKLLSKATSMPVLEVTDNLPVEADHVYVIPPNRTLSIARGVLKLHPRKRGRTPTRSIDSFFESLAADQRERSIGVILSGIASDGTVGLEAIKAEGGITFAQDDSAKYDSMPHSAVGAGCVDFVLSPEYIAAELARIAKHPYIAGQPLAEGSNEDDPAVASAHEDDETSLPSGGQGTPRTGAKQVRAEAAATSSTHEDDGFKKILLLLRNHSGVDFSLYKSTTIQRRITRRMILNKTNSLDDYASFLLDNAKELDALYSDALISVTSFFRNPEGFDVLKRKVFPKLLQHQGDDPFRIWVLGCSTGQEAYSLAMAFVESAEKAPRLSKLQVFATDLNDALLEKARHGLYAKSLAEDVSPERLRRFFIEEEGGYRIVKSLREMVVFARQNVISDPPFSRMDLISCRNLLIYLEPSLQKKALPTFHYALRRGGVLFLGASESIGSFTELFEPLDKKHKIYSKKAAQTPAFHLPAKRERSEQLSSGRTQPPLPEAVERETSPGFRVEINAQREADRVTLNRFAPPAVLINAELQILQFRGPTSAYLQPPSTGKATFDVLKMAREGLMLPLRTAINKAKKEHKKARRENILVDQNGNTRTVNIEVIPLMNLQESCFLIVFEDPEKTVGAADATSMEEPKRTTKVPQRKSKEKESRRNVELERELSETREYLQAIQEQYEAANEELQASSEEVQSANEELQSINEELETSKEELESTNEELITVNEEMVNRNAELTQLFSDIINFQSSINVAILLLGLDLSIRRFTQPAEKLFNLLASDIGRPIGVIKDNLNFPGLETLVSDVIENLAGQEREVRDSNGRWFLLRVRPYMTLDNKIDGAVLILVDITIQKQAEEANGRLAAIIESSDDAIISKDLNGIIATWNQGAQNLFGYKAEEAIGKPITMLIAPQRMDEESHILQRIGQGKQVDYYETIGMRKDGATVDISLVVSPIFDNDGNIVGASRIARDITERKRIEEERAALLLREQAARAQAEAANRMKDEFLAMVSHELRTPLNAIVGWTHLVKSKKLNQKESERAIETIDRNATAQAAIISELLDVSRIISGKLKLDIKPLDLADVINAAVDAIRPAADAKAIEVITLFNKKAGLVSGDAVRLQQVFWNLLTNAIKFTPHEGIVKIEFKPDGKYVAVVVSDNGSGIPADFLPHIFERFQQADTSEKRTHGGLGLGLSIVHHLVEMHEGSVTASSEGEGRGASFTVTIPVLTVSARKSLPASRDLSIERSVYSTEHYDLEDHQDLELKPDILTGVRVLAVDDQPDTRDLIILALTQYGAEVKACPSAIEARKMIENWKPEVIVSDIGMPGEDGYDLMRKVRALTPESGGTIPAVALTGYAGAVDESQAYAAGYQAHITKPVELRELATTVAKLAGRSKDLTQTRF